MDKFLRDSEVEDITGLSRTTRWRLEREGKFPKKYPVTGGAAKRNLESEVRSWMKEIVAA